ncbi:MAG: hypothetical protein L6Q99_12400 [Planctomycetes bacterium]|nr:hypothetical protein [Planctomycetota bacterium]
MKKLINGKAALLTAVIGAGAAGSANAAEILVTADISTSTTWTANNTYNLQNQIYVLPGATLTIEPGTLIQSDTGVGGSLAVCKGAQIFVQGTSAKPVVFTSKADTLTGWHEGVNEWGNLTIMGAAYISENAIATNTPAPNAANVAPMEGLVAAFPGDTKVLYGGGNDDDDSGSVSYASFRYGGKVIGLNNELNGLSLGGIGRNTDLHHIEILSNVDDGIEIWGGTVNLKHFSIWYVGDDSLDIDQGWRGKAQNGLIVQGYSANASQGSGVGDNAIEMDGAEQSDYQPVTTGTLYNLTVIGQPIDGDHGTAWRDNCRMQVRNSIFMELGEELVKFDNVDGDGGAGYGFNGTLSWANTWATAYNAVPAHGNDFTTGTYTTNYPAQVDGNLAEIKDSVFYNNPFANAYTQATTVGVFNAGNNNVTAVASPITAITRAAPVVKGGKTMLQVTSLDPRPANDAVTSVGSAPNDGFFTPQQYRGAFDPACGQTWLDGWTATYAYGITPTVSGPAQYCTAKVNSLGCTPTVASTGTPSVLNCSSNAFTLSASGLLGNKNGLWFYGTNGLNGVAFQGGHLCIKLPIKRLNVLNTGGQGSACNGTLSTDFNARICSGSDTALVAGTLVGTQCWSRDPASPSTTNLTSGISFVICP